ncbi:MAG: GIY-YIG nuclease family protein [Candidatus Omnitrophica bacterium]|nr:GIY-YIG nuclease family protein [Candidatus Omnitrophota bacterium]
MARAEKAIPKRRRKKNWSVYILICSDGTLYTGATNDIKRRLSTHNNGTGARYTRSRRPVTLVYQENSMTRPQALTRECAIKALSKKDKEGIIAVGKGLLALSWPRVPNG